MGCRQGTIFLKMVASISSSLGITASIASGSVIERATFLTIWAKKRQVFVPKAATFSFHLQLHILFHDLCSQSLFLDGHEATPPLFLSNDQATNRLFDAGQ